MKKDSKNHLYTDIDSIRATYVPASNREPSADWSGFDVIRIQAYRGGEDKSLHRGAELPVSSPEVFVRLLAALCTLYNEGQPPARSPALNGVKVEKGDLIHYLKGALVALGGRARIPDVCRRVWEDHEHDLRASEELFFTWQYDIRWAADELRTKGVMKPKGDSRKGVWELA